VAEAGLSSSDLGILAARQALADAGAEPDGIELVITATISPDRLMPATAARIAHECGCGNAGAFDVSAGCSGFVYALAMAAGAVASGQHDRVLVVGAETISRILDWQDRSTAVLFGDGAGAVVVEPHDPATGDGSAGILGFDLGGDGSGVEFLSIPAGGSRLPASAETVAARQHYMKMNGNEVFKFATRVVSHSASRVLERCGRSVADIDLFVPHQANLRIIDSAISKLGIDKDKVYTNLQKYGNTSCASIPLCLSEARAEGRLHEGDLVLLMGFGAGLSWGACLLEWGHDRSSGSQVDEG
jgi:3-oxoacyl-[acyl-carrier-protein] synthase-3